jgi:hypothetical protein
LAIVNTLSFAALLVNAGLILLAGLYVLSRYNQSRLRQSLYWGFGLVSLGVSYIFLYGLAVGLAELTVPANFIQETLLSITITLFYYACAAALTKKKFYSTFLAWVILFLQEAAIVYFYLILNKDIIGVFVNVVLIGIPVAILVAVFFSIDYLSFHRVASLLIAFSFWFQLVLVPTYLLTYQTALDLVYFSMNAADAFVQFTGFILLARSK